MAALAARAEREAADRLAAAAGRDGGSLRILVICYEFPPAGGGGGRVADIVARGLAERGHRLRVLTSHVRGLARAETAGGVSVRRAFAGRRHLDRCTVPEMAAYLAAQTGPALAEIARFRPDVVHAHFAVPSGAVAWAATRMRPAPYVVTAHLGDVPGGAPEQTAHLYRWATPFTLPIWRAAAALTAVAPHVADLAEGAYGRRPRVIPNGIPMHGRTAPAIRPAGEPVRAVWVGRIQEQKNLGPAVTALARLAGRNWVLDVIGDGPLRGEVESRAAAAGLAAQIRFRGWQPADAVERALSASDLLFLPSLSEGLSMVTVEALKAGLAFVASRIPGTSGVVDGENGILCDPADPGSFASALAGLVEDRERLFAMRRASAARAPLYDAARMIDAYQDVLRNASRCAGPA